MDSQNQIINLKKYLKKLHYFIDNDAIFTFNETKIVNKLKTDDILCCIEASIPNEYKQYIELHGILKLNTNRAYMKLIEAVRNKFALSNNIYSIRYKQALDAINFILDNIDSDMAIVYED